MLSKTYCTAAVLLLALSAERLAGDDSDRFRPYLHIRRGEFNYRWGLHDMWGVGAGVNLNRHWGVELAVDTWENILRDPVVGSVGEVAVGSLTARSRMPSLAWAVRFMSLTIASRRVLVSTSTLTAMVWPPRRVQASISS